MKNRLPLTAILYLVSFVSFSQQANYWFFGQGAGLDFTMVTPKVITGALYTYEGCATISDAKGNLLFYTNGIFVYNRNHQQMPNGYGLLGVGTPTQASTIVPKPGSDYIFYIITTDSWETGQRNGLNYSIVDMRLDSGLGDITDKNILLYPFSTEKVTVVKHANNEDFWVVSHEYNTDVYYAHLITEAGLNPVPIVTKIGAFQGPDDTHGVMRSSEDGKMIISILNEIKTVEIMDFDRGNGTISNLVGKAFPEMYLPYGAEFSQDQSKLYVTDLNNLFQFDMLAGSYMDILNSIVKVPSAATTYQIGQLQLGADGKIYVGMDDSDYLGVINHPDSASALCDFQVNGLYLEGKKSGLGLPNFMSSFINPFCFRELELGEDRTLCEGEPVILELACDCDFNWSDGSTNNSLSVKIPGLYWVEVSNGICTLSDSIVIEPEPPLLANFDEDTTLCATQKLLLKVEQEGSTFLWSNNSTGSELEVSSSGDYWVDIYYEDCQTRKSVHADFKDFVPLDLGLDATVCSPETLTLSINENWGQILWSNNSSERSMIVESAGMYWAEMRSDYCYDRDSIEVKFKDKPSINLGDDLKLCLGETVKLDASFPSSSYLWSTNATTAMIEVTESGNYSVVVRLADSECQTSDAVNVVYEECLDDLFIPNVITPDGDTRNDFFEIKGAEGTKWNLIIYNRWGVKIFETMNYADNWYGQDEPSGTYYFSLTSQFSGKHFKGWVEVKK